MVKLSQIYHKTFDVNQLLVINCYRRNVIAMERAIESVNCSAANFNMLLDSYFMRSIKENFRFTISVFDISLGYRKTLFFEQF